ncbi:hypothetical protein ACFWZ2_37215 [Streptomyces sp. NPDC059002]|uniref:hypothetical protein n=1 Tax=Streptomyces sp. NPDC059002 TaxID=3346690 RepID=UPI0036BF6EB5
MTPVPNPGQQTFAARLNLLFEASAPEDAETPGRYVEYTNQQVADEINRRHGAGTITAEYIRRLRKEGGPQPTAPYMSVLADFFGVPLDVFNLTSTAASTTANEVIAELEHFLDQRLQRQERDGNETLAVLARSASRLSPQGQARVVKYAQSLQQVEELEHEAGEGETKQPKHD